MIGEAMAPKQREALRSQLLGLGYPAYLELVRELLVALGYRDVAPLRSGAIGGADIQTSFGSGVTETHILVQAKRSAGPVHRRFVDELRGAVLRFGYGQGLVVAASGFSQAAREAARRNPVAPVRLMGGEELTNFLCAFRIGVRRDTLGRLVPDGRYFANLRRRHPGQGRRGPGKKKAFRAFWEEEDDPFPRAMMFRSHALVAVNSLWLLWAVPSGVASENVGVLAALAVFGAMLPDLDARRSAIRSFSVGGVRPFQPIGWAANRYLGHRGLLHSAWGLAIAALLASAVVALAGWQAGLALWLGYASHLLADACTKTGIPFLPRRGKAHLLPQRLRLSTGSAAEDALLPLLAGLALLLLLSSMYAR